MKLLLDTHVVIWAMNQPHRLAKPLQQILISPDHDVIVSAVSAYEIEFKRHRDPIIQQLPQNLARAIADQGFSWLPATTQHMIEGGRLPRHHGDPWDRILIAQAKVENAILVTADPWIASYDVKTLW